MTVNPKEQAGHDSLRHDLLEDSDMQDNQNQEVMEDRMDDAEDDNTPQPDAPGNLPDPAAPVEDNYTKDNETDASSDADIPADAALTVEEEVISVEEEAGAEESSPGTHGDISLAGEFNENEPVDTTDAGEDPYIPDETDEEDNDEMIGGDAGKEEIDFTAYTRQEIVEHLRKLIEDGDTDAIRGEIDAIKFTFYKKLKAETDQHRLEYEENGGAADDYVYEEDTQELILKNLLNKYRELRNLQNEQLETEKQSNLEEKLKIIEELKDLTSSTESIGGTFQIFRELQNRWRNGGLVPQAEVKNLWDTYHHYVEVFYDYIKINKELRDLDFKRNLEAKIELCEKAENLLLEPSVVSAFHTLQTYHDQWREIGPVPQEMRVEIWERFKSASTQVNRKHQEYFETLKESQKKNLEAKAALCEKVEEIMQRPMETMLHWEKSAKEIIEMQKLWNTIGYAAKKDNAKVYRRFRSLCDKFFSNKREFFSKEKVIQENNLQLKEDLCVQAEALKESTEWKSTTEDLISLQKKWKEIGNVPAKYREAIWKRFRTACDYFFEQKAKHYSSVDSEYDNNLKAKKELIEKIRNFVSSKNTEEDFEQLKEFQRQWSDIGFVPIKYKKKIQDEYREAINKQFDDLKLDDNERDRLRYKSKIENLKSTSQSRGKLESEREKLMRKYQQLQNDLVVWENNIGFFSKSKNSEAMIANVQQMIEEGRTELKTIEEKIRIIDSVEDVDQ